MGERDENDPSIKWHLADLESELSKEGFWGEIEKAVEAADLPSESAAESKAAEENPSIKTNPRFGEIKASMKGFVDEQYPRLCDNLQKFSVYGESKLVGMNGKVGDGVKSFVEIAAHLKMFDEEAFNKYVSLKPSFWQFVEYEIGTLDKPEQQLDFLYYAKILFPEKFEGGQYKPALTYEMAAPIIKLIIDNKASLSRFLDNYSKLAFLDKEETRNRLPISKDDWEKIIVWVQKQPEGYLRSMAASWAEFARPDGDKTTLLNLEDWEKCKINISGERNRFRENEQQQAFKQVLKMSLPLKFLRIPAPDKLPGG